MHQLTRAFVAGLAVALAACAPAPPATVSFRAVGAPIWSNAQFDAQRMLGRWQQVAAFDPGGGGCVPGGAEIGGAAGALTVAARLCLAGREMRLSGPLTRSGPGRFRLGDQEWWVLWVDTDYRTVAVGTPSGDFGFILNRDGALPPDRLRAAAEVFDFNGYDTRNLRAY